MKLETEFKNTIDSIKKTNERAVKMVLQSLIMQRVQDMEPKQAILISDFIYNKLKEVNGIDELGSLNVDILEGLDLKLIWSNYEIK